MRHRARLLWAWTLIGGAAVVLGSLGVFLGVLSPLRGFIDALVARPFFRVCLAALGGKVRVVERRVAPKTLPRQVVIVANHESHLDGPAITTTLTDRSIRYVGKRELFRLPFFGWAAYLAGNIALSRGDTARDIAALRDPRIAARGHDILFFAEGTRSKDGALQPFKRGAFAFAIANGLPILPVAVVGGFEILQPQGRVIRAGPMAVCVGTPIPVTGLSHSDRQDLLDRARLELASLRAEGLARLGLGPR